MVMMCLLPLPPPSECGAPDLYLHLGSVALLLFTSTSPEKRGAPALYLILGGAPAIYLHIGNVARLLFTSTQEMWRTWSLTSPRECGAPSPYLQQESVPQMTTLLFAIDLSSRSVCPGVQGDNLESTATIEMCT